jgi:N-methylhydantoinase A
VRIGVDVGGTFTDVCLLDSAGHVEVTKLRSTPSDPSDAVAKGVADLLIATGHDPGRVAYFGHGTTVATNALLERRGAMTGIITTAGFRDLLELARQRRPDLYDLQVEKPTPLVPRRDRLEVPERIRVDGTIEQQLDEEAVRLALIELRDRGLGAIAVCFLHSYLYPEHEECVARVAREVAPNLTVSLSHRVVAEFREYERLSTTVANAYVAPTMARYFERLRTRVRATGVPVDPYVTQSNGGLISLEVASDVAIRTILSGPAAGVMAASYITRLAGITNVISFDMGGTSTDVSLIHDGDSSTRPECEIGGIPIRTRMLDINTVGAGGGSIAWIDSGGHMKVGPQSAGAHPGPAAYGRGGTHATVTDANIALGLLNRERILGGRMSIDSTAADRVVADLGASLRLDRVACAHGIISIVTATMARALRLISVERGHDPRDYALLALGGAGPLHAARLARELNIPQFIVPTVPGLLCALGLLVAPLRVDFSRTCICPATESSLPEVETVFAGLQREADLWMEAEDLPHESRAVRRVADLRYPRQNYELSVSLPQHPMDTAALAQLIAAFHAAHDQAYGFASPGEQVQFVTLRLEAVGHVPTVDLPRIPPAVGDVSTARVAHRPIYLGDPWGEVQCPVYDRNRLSHGHNVPGPAIIEQMDTTTLVLPGQHTRVDPYGNLLVTEQD